MPDQPFVGRGRLGPQPEGFGEFEANISSRTQCDTDLIRTQESEHPGSEPGVFESGGTKVVFVVFWGCLAIKTETIEPTDTRKCTHRSLSQARSTFYVLSHFAMYHTQVQSVKCTKYTVEA